MLKKIVRVPKWSGQNYYCCSDAKLLNPLKMNVMREQAAVSRDMGPNTVEALTAVCCAATAPMQAKHWHDCDWLGIQTDDLGRMDGAWSVACSGSLVTDADTASSLPSLLSGLCLAFFLLLAACDCFPCSRSKSTKGW